MPRATERIRRVLATAGLTWDLKREDRIGRGEARVVAAVMSWPVVKVSVESTVRDADALLRESGVHHLPVMRSSRVVGVVCPCDLSDAPIGSRVRDFMSAPAVTVGAADPLEAAASLMERERVSCLPVLAGGRLFGVVTRWDLVRAGALGPETLHACAACGAHHEVRPLDDAGTIWFCRPCLENAVPPSFPEYYQDIGGGD